jgi:TatD DNase family protein
VTSVRLVDSHCHLSFDPLVADLDGVLGRARERGVDRILVPAYDPDSWPVVRDVATREGVFAAYGLHPWRADEPLEPRALEKALDQGAVAVGEIGLDFKIAEPGRARQLEVLRLQLDLAADRGLPVLLHCRGAFEELLGLLAEYAGRLTGVVHAFSRGPELARRFLDAGMHLAFGGALTRPRARRPRRSAQVAPLERVLLETDAPSIGLDGVAPKDVEPHHVRDVAKALAELRGASIDEIARSTTANAERLFQLG